MDADLEDMIEYPNYEQWLVVSSNDESYDSDKIDSDIESELYSVTHHKADNSVTRDLSNTNHRYLSNMPSTNITCGNTSKRNKPPNRKLKNSFDTLSKGITVESPKNNKQALKRKSDLIAGFLEDRKSIDKALKKKKVTKPSCSETNNKQSRNWEKEPKEKTPVIESSDSDSVIYIETESFNAETNIGHDAVSLSSSSDLESSLWSDEERGSFSSLSFRNASLPNLSLDESSSVSDPWHIDSEDLYRRNKRQSSRYHERAARKCKNCNTLGHSAKFCPVPKVIKCFICGGNHMGSRCKNKLCFKCQRCGHDSRFCYQRDIVVCILCNMKGHIEKDCPDLWRRYHLTTQGKKVVPGRNFPQDSPLYCFNCGQMGHYGSNCQGPRLDKWANPTWTSVVTYSHPSRENSRPKHQMSSNGNIQIWPQMQNDFAPPSDFLTPKQRKKERRRNKKKSLQSANILLAERSERNMTTPDFPRTKKKDLKTKQQDHLKDLRRRLGLIP